MLWSENSMCHTVKALLLNYLALTRAILCRSSCFMPVELNKLKCGEGCTDILKKKISVPLLRNAWSWSPRMSCLSHWVSGCSELTQKDNKSTSWRRQQRDKYPFHKTVHTFPCKIPCLRNATLDKRCMVSCDVQHALIKAHENARAQTHARIYVFYGVRCVNYEITWQCRTVNILFNSLFI